VSGILDRIEVYQDEKGEWRFRGKARNHEIVATGEGYKDKRDVMNIVEDLVGGRNIPVVIYAKDDPELAG